MRIISFIAVTLFTTLWSLPALAASFDCSKDVKVPSQILDKAYVDYGTAYAGGMHFNLLENIAPTIDLYRSLNGLEHIDFNKAAKQFDYELNSRELKDKLITAIENNSISKKSGYLTERQKHDLSVIYDLGLTIFDSRLDWWINPDTKFSDYSKKISTLAETHESLDWILSIMSASYLPWSIDWHLEYKSEQKFEKGRRNILTHALRNFEISNNDQWLIVASMYAIEDDPEIEMIKGHFKELIEIIIKCEQTNRQYISLNMLSYELTRILGRDFFISHHFFMSDVIKGYAFERLYKQETAQFFKSNKTEADRILAVNNLKNLSKTIDNKYYLRKVSVALGYLSNDTNSLISNINYVTNEYAPSEVVDAKLMRSFNILDIDSLIEIALNLKLDDENKQILLNNALNRSFVLGQYAKSQKVLTYLIDYLDDEKKLKVVSNLESDLPLDVKLAIAIFNIQEKTTWIVNLNIQPDIEIANEIYHKSGTDLSDKFLDGSFLNRDLHTFLMHPSQWGAYHDISWGSVINRVQRHDVRRRIDNDLAVGFQFETEPTFKFENNIETSILKMFDKDELQNYSPKKGLARKLSEVILNWEQDKGTKWYFRSSYHNEIATNLARIIRLQKRNATGKIGDNYIGEIAYKKLKSRYFDTEPSRATKYWFYCEQNCR